MGKFSKEYHLVGQEGTRRSDGSLRFLPVKSGLSDGLLGLMLWGLAGIPFVAFAVFFHFFGPDPDKVAENMGVLYFFYGLGGFFLFIGVQSFFVAFRRWIRYSVENGDLVIAHRRWKTRKDRFPVEVLQALHIEIQRVVVRPTDEFRRKRIEDYEKFWVWWVIVEVDQSSSKLLPPDIRFRTFSQDYEPRTNHIPDEVNALTTWLCDALDLNVTGVTLTGYPVEEN